MRVGQKLLVGVLGAVLASAGSLAVAVAPAAAQDVSAEPSSVPQIIPGSGEAREVGRSGGFLVNLSAPSNQTITVDWATEDYEAKAPDDFAPQSGTLTFEPGQTQYGFGVTFNDDAIEEPDEAMVIRFSNPTNATVGGYGGIGAVVILNDDPTIVPGAVWVTEGDAGTKSVNVPVNLSSPASRTVTADWHTQNNGGTWPGHLPGATAPEDFVAASGTVTFAPGQTQRTVAVTVKGDTRFESDERLVVAFENPTNASLGGFFGFGVATIVNDDPGLPVITPGSGVANERDGRATLTVDLSVPSDETVTAHWETLNFSAKAPSDFVADSGITTFKPREVQSAIKVHIRNDAVEEPDEVLLVRFSSPTNATIAASGDVGSITIRNDDPTIVPHGTSITEGDAGTKVVKIPVTLTGPSSRTVSASWRTRNDIIWGDTAKAPGDYVAASGTITFAPGQTQKTVAVTIKGDTLHEPTERVVVDFTNPVNAPGGIGGFLGLGYAQIIDDD